jgi:hypothetical protein
MIITGSTPPGPPAIKFPKHDDPIEICITFRIGDLQGADSRSIFVTVQSDKAAMEELFISKFIIYYLTKSQYTL